MVSLWDKEIIVFARSETLVLVPLAILHMKFFECEILRMIESTTSSIWTKFKENIQNNSPLIIFGDGSAIRDFVHIDDVVNAIILSISHSKNSLCNIASGISTSISELAQIMIALSDKDIKISNESLRSGEIMFSSSDIFLAKEILKFTPKITLKHGLEQFMSK